MENNEGTGEADFDSLWREIEECQEKNSKAWDSDSEKFWGDLSPQDRLKAFTAVTKRIHQGWSMGRSYRGVLYGVFGFGREAYSVGIASGYFDIYCNLPSKEFDLSKSDDSAESSG